jgi:hypothetical protein
MLGASLLFKSRPFFLPRLPGAGNIAVVILSVPLVGVP